MELSEQLERENRLAAERSSKYWGTASVLIDLLDFPNEEDEENIDRLAELFAKDCRVLNPFHHIPAKIDKQQLQDALSLSDLTPEQLRAIPDPQEGYPKLNFPAGFRLQCNRGLHRAAAARRIHMERWAVDFFHPGSLNRAMISAQVDNK